jgi:pimeloyl-ACP methyl ester carboxylesterase
MRLLVFLHGLGQQPLMWQDQVTALPSGVKAMAPWLKGLRPARHDEFTLDAAADEVLGLLNVHGVDSMAICGHSLGAMVGLTAAVRAPECISHLVLAAPQPAPSRATILAQRAAFALMPRSRFRAMGVEKESMLSALDALRDANLHDRLPTVSADTLLINGAADAAGTQAAQGLAEGIPQARLESIPDAGVAVNSEQPGRFNELLYTHLGF